MSTHVLLFKFNFVLTLQCSQPLAQRKGSKCPEEYPVEFARLNPTALPHYQLGEFVEALLELRQLQNASRLPRETRKRSLTNDFSQFFQFVKRSVPKKG